MGLWLKELDLLNEDANVYKLIGPVLVKQDLAEANANVRKRIDYMSAELYVLLSLFSLSFRLVTLVYFSSLVPYLDVWPWALLLTSVFFFLREGFISHYQRENEIGSFSCKFLVVNHALPHKLINFFMDTVGSFPFLALILQEYWKWNKD